MEASNLSSTLKQRRKFEYVEETNMDDHQNTSSVNNHNSDLCTIDKIRASINHKIQTLKDCSKESTDKCFLQEKKMDNIDPNNVSSVQKNNIITVNKTILKMIHINVLVLTIIGCFLPLFVSIYLDHMTLRFIYISETAFHFPEISIFSQCMDLIMIFGALSMYLRYRILAQFIQDREENIINTYLQNISNFSAIFMIVGIATLGNYPAFGITHVMHIIGVTMYMIGVTMYSIIQTKFTKNMIGILSDIYIYYIRLIISVVLSSLLFLFLLTGVIASQQFKGNDMNNWGRNDGGWLMHVISVIGEWCHTILFSIFIFSLIYEYHAIRFEMPIIKITYIGKKKMKELNSEVVQDTIVQ